MQTVASPAGPGPPARGPACAQHRAAFHGQKEAGDAGEEANGKGIRRSKLKVKMIKNAYLVGTVGVYET